MAKVKIVDETVMSAYAEGKAGDVVELDDHLAEIAIRENWATNATSAKVASATRSTKKAAAKKR